MFIRWSLHLGNHSGSSRVDWVFCFSLKTSDSIITKLLYNINNKTFITSFPSQSDSNNPNVFEVSQFLDLYQFL